MLRHKGLRLFGVRRAGVERSETRDAAFDGCYMFGEREAGFRARRQRRARRRIHGKHEIDGGNDMGRLDLRGEQLSSLDEAVEARMSRRVTRERLGDRT